MKLKNATVQHDLVSRVNTSKTFTDTYMGQEYVTFVILERPFMSMYNAQQNTLMEFTVDLTLSANIGFYPKFSDTFAASINKRTNVVDVREPTMAHVYNPAKPSPAKPPPKTVNPETVVQDSNFFNALPTALSKQILPKMPQMKWMSEAAEAMGEAGEAALKFSVDAAPYALEAAEVLLPLLLDDLTQMVSAKAEIRRYEAVIAQTKLFGDDQVLNSVEDAFKTQLAYYQTAIDNGVSYVAPYTIHIS